MIQSHKVLITLVLSLVLASAAQCAYEDSGFNVRSISMGSAFTAIDGDPASVYYNPAGLGTARHTQLTTDFLRQFSIPAGAVNQEVFATSAIIPVHQEIINGTLGFSGIFNRRVGVARDRTIGFSYGTRNFWELEGGGINLGMSLKFLKTTYDATSSAGNKTAVDLGLMWRFKEKYTFGASILNANRPSISGPSEDRAPAMIKLGISETAGSFVLAADVTKREPSGGHPGTANIGLGFEHWWATVRHGSIAFRSGLNLGDRVKTWHSGIGWTLMGAQLNYALTIPITGAKKFGHGISIIFRFGVSDMEGEYEKLLSHERRSRQDLIESLDAGDIKQWQLSEELNRLRSELDALKSQLKDKTVTASQTGEKLKILQEKEQKARENFLRVQSEAKKLAERTQETLFKEDWSAYKKLRMENTPDSVLLDHVRRFLTQYRSSGFDLSEANQELLRLQRSR